MSSELEEEVSNGSNGSNSSCFSLEDTSLGVLALHATLLSTILVLSVAGNALVLVLVARYKELRTRSTMVSLSMVIADLLFTFFYTFPALVTTGTKDWVFKSQGCIVFGFFASDIQITRWLLVSLLCVDRFATVRYPFSYKKKQGKRLMMTLICLAWIVPFALSAIPIHLFATFELRENFPTCLPSCRDTGRGCGAYYFLLFTATFIIGTVIPISLYSWLYRKARYLRKSIKYKMGNLTMQIASGIVISRPVGEYRKMKRENQATITFLLIFVAVVVSGTPSYLLQIIRFTSIDLHCKMPILIHFLFVNLFLSAPMVTPLVIMRDKAFRTAITKLVLCGSKTGDMDFRHSSRHSSSPRPPPTANGNLEHYSSRRPSIIVMSFTLNGVPGTYNPQPNNNTGDNVPTSYTISESNSVSST